MNYPKCNSTYIVETEEGLRCNECSYIWNEKPLQLSVSEMLYDIIATFANYDLEVEVFYPVVRSPLWGKANEVLIRHTHNLFLKIQISSLDIFNTSIYHQPSR